MNGLWEKANELDEVGYQVHSLASVAAMLGEAMADNVNSGVAWALHEMLKVYSDKIDRISTELMAINRANEEAKVAKGKKK